METLNYNQTAIFDKDFYTIEWSDIENTEIDYDNYLMTLKTFSDKILRMSSLKNIVY
ncbi:hypothetical protein GCM10023210_21980 [Chryseobacterium ginsengisoli]|uniref:Uncharacterized protein n=1 Tax=Chryseobacterium ginsengisoli TaxID=363853 RepID=A0ABP9MC13_9FLAO